MLYLLPGTYGAGLPPPSAINISLIRSLTSLQRGGYTPPGGMAGRVTFNVVRDIKTRGLLPQLDQADDATLYIVAMLFDYILDDKHLPVTLRSHIARLQIPLLKIAFIDRDFFIKKSHPARRLLNTITQAGIESVGDAIFQEALADLVDHVAQRISNEFEEDVGLLVKLQTQLEQDIAAVRREIASRTGRTVGVVRNPTRQERAKRRIRALIDARLDQASPGSPAIHDTVRNFILTHWQQLLILHFVQDGEHSASLYDAIHTMDDLIWSVAPKQDAAERDRLNRLRPGLIQRLHQGMDRLALPLLARTGFLDKLAKCLAEAVRLRPQETTDQGAGSEDASLAIAAALFEEPLHPTVEAGTSPAGNGGEGPTPRHALPLDSPLASSLATAKNFDPEDITMPREVFLKMAKTVVLAPTTASPAAEKSGQKPHDHHSDPSGQE